MGSSMASHSGLPNQHWWIVGGVCSTSAACTAIMIPLLGRVFKRRHTNRFMTVQDEVAGSFARIDTDHNRSISVNDFRAALGVVGARDDLTTSIFQALDADHSGEVHVDEFLNATTVLLQGSFAERVRFAFDLIDTEHTGVVTKAQFMRFSKMAITDGVAQSFFDPEEVFDSMDSQRSGAITFEQYLMAMEQSPLARRTPRHRPGAVYFGHASFDLVMRLMLCIHHSLTCVDDVCKRTDVVQRRLPSMRVGDQKLEWTEDGANIFRSLRAMYNISETAFVQSLGVERFIAALMVGQLTTFTALASTGKSGSTFFETYDGKYLLKIIPKREYMKLRKFLPRYYEHVTGVQGTLMCLLMGMYKFTLPKRGRIRVIMMVNAFSSCRVQQMFDMKGATFGRNLLQGDEDPYTTPTQQLDGDVVRSNRRFRLGSRREEIMLLLRRDTEFLASEGLYDYSLIMALHSASDSTTRCRTPLSFHTCPSNGSFCRSSSSSSSSCSSDGSSHDEVDDYASLCLIDFLTRYTLRRAVEWYFKSLTVAFRESVSACPPRYYAARLQSFIANVTRGSHHHHHHHHHDHHNKGESEEHSLCDMD
eukprot:PhM_4_TR3190/c0_g1_i1/m.8030/K00889/PIP5K; 1-phosphatidylinositol-4-phosphate 5-kinase